MVKAPDTPQDWGGMAGGGSVMHGSAPLRKAICTRCKMTKHGTQPSRLIRAMLETADDMRRVGIMDAASHEKITFRHLGSDAGSIEPLSGEEIRALRERAS